MSRPIAMSASIATRLNGLPPTRTHRHATIVMLDVAIFAPPTSGRSLEEVNG